MLAGPLQKKNGGIYEIVGSGEGGDYMPIRSSHGRTENVDIGSEVGTSR